MKNIVLTLLTMLSMTSAFAEITIKRLKDVPQNIQYKGKPVDVREINDSEGRHVVVLSKVEDKTMGEQGYQSEIFAYKYTYINGEYKKNWEIKEFNPSALVTVDFLDQLQIADIDKDGIAETVFVYEIAPDGLDPITLKLMLHYKDSKYAIRGEIPQQDSDEYRKKVDPSFDHLPASVKTYALKFWDRTVKKMRQQN